MIDDRLDGDLQGRRGLFQRSVEERGRLAGQHGVGREGVHAALVNELGLRELLVLHHGNDKLAEALRTLGFGGSGAFRGVVSEDEFFGIDAKGQSSRDLEVGIERKSADKEPVGVLDGAVGHGDPVSV